MPKAMPTLVDPQPLPSSELVPPRGLYEKYEREWIAAQVSALAEGDLNRLDRPILIEYLTEMTARDRIPGLRRQADAVAASAYPDAVRRVARETGLPAESFPTMSPRTVMAALAFDPPEPIARGKRDLPATESTH